MILGIPLSTHKKPAFGRYHHVDAREPYTTAEACTAWDHLPLEHPVPLLVDEAGAPLPYYFRTACGVELPHTRLDARWVTGKQVTCTACQRLAPPVPAPEQLALLGDNA